MAAPSIDRSQPDALGTLTSSDPAASDWSESATFTVADGTVAISLENPVTAVPPSEPPVDPDTPSVPGTPNVPTAADGSLAVTGADSGPLLLIAAGTLLTGALLLVVRRVRRRD
ncbi:LPXTG cell wall anchor domain-containing protein [Microbacterium sp. NPDC055665]